MSKNEVETLLQAQYNNELSKEAIEVALKEIDVNGDRAITYDEFLTWACEKGYERLSSDKAQVKARLHVAHLFDDIDVNTNGWISTEDVPKLVANLQVHGLYTKTLETFQCSLDKDGDGKIQFKEIIMNLEK